MSRFTEYLEGAKMSRDGVNWVDAESVKNRRMKDKGFPQYKEQDDVKLVYMADLDDFLKDSKYDTQEVTIEAEEEIEKSKKHNDEERKKNPKSWLSSPSLEYARSGIMMKEWAKDNNAFYYAKPHEDFSTYEAIRLAKKAGNKVVILDDMS